jgi:ligand-binding sensor domain-containing protein
MKRILSIVILMLTTHVLMAQNSDWMCFYETSALRCIAEDSEFIWAGSISGITRVNKGDGQVTWYNQHNSPFPYRMINGMTIDAAGDKWFLCDAGMLFKLHGNEWTVYDSLQYYVGYFNLAHDVVAGNNNDIWVDAHNKLIRFDGVNWHVYDNTNSGLPYNNIDKIYFADGLLWVGNQSTITSFDGTDWVSYTSPHQVHRVEDMEKDNEGNLWILHTYALQKFDTSGFTVYNAGNTNLDAVYMLSIDIDQQGVKWITCERIIGYDSPEGGLMSFSDTTWIKYDTGNSMINDVNINELVIDDAGNKWFGNRSGDIAKFVDSSNCTYYDLAPSKLDNHSVFTIIADKAGYGYVGTAMPNMGGYALYRTNLDTWTPIPFYKGSEYSIGTDGTGTLYIKYDKVYKLIDNDTVGIPGCPFIDTSIEVYGDAHNFVVTDAGEIWMDFTDTIIGNESYDGIAHYNGSTWTIWTVDNSPIPSHAIHDIKMASDGSVWISTKEGLAHYSNGTWAVYNTLNSPLPFNNVSKIAIDQPGNVWFNDKYSGLYKFTGSDTTHFVNNSIYNTPGFGTPVIDTDGSIWQCLQNMVNRFDGTEFTHHFTYQNSHIGLGSMKALSIDKYGNKWIGSGEGFVVYRDGGVITDLPAKKPASELSVHTYPNPFTSQVRFDLPRQQSTLTITLHDAQGRPLYRNHFSNTHQPTIKPNLPKGTYFYRITTGEGVVYSGKIVRE